MGLSDVKLIYKKQDTPVELTPILNALDAFCNSFKESIEPNNLPEENFYLYCIKEFHEKIKLLMKKYKMSIPRTRMRHSLRVKIAKFLTTDTKMSIQALTHRFTKPKLLGVTITETLDKFEDIIKNVILPPGDEGEKERKKIEKLKGYYIIKFYSEASYVPIDTKKELSKLMSKINLFYTLEPICKVLDKEIFYNELKIFSTKNPDVEKIVLHFNSTEFENAINMARDDLLIISKSKFSERLKEKSQKKASTNVSPHLQTQSVLPPKPTRPAPKPPTPSTSTSKSTRNSFRSFKLPDRLSKLLK